MNHQFTIESFLDFLDKSPETTFDKTDPENCAYARFLKRLLNPEKIIVGATTWYTWPGDTTSLMSGHKLPWPLGEYRLHCNSKTYGELASKIRNEIANRSKIT